MIKGQKVIIRPVEREDLGFVMELYNDEEISLLEGRWEFHLTMEHQQHWFERNYDDPLKKYFVIWDSKAKKRIGYTSLNEINWQSRIAHQAIKLHKGAEGEGYGYDAIMTLTFREPNLRGLNLFTDIQ